MPLLNSSSATATGRALPAFTVALALALGGCGKSRVEESQVVARVNSDEVSVHQLNYAIGQVPNQVRSAAEREALLDKMIDRQLAVQRSLAQGLDRRPAVMLRLEEARRDILAAAYVDEVTGKIPAPTEEACAQYYAQHPGLFANRKIYRLREISIPEDVPAIAEAQTRLERKERVADVINWLHQQPGRYSDQVSLRPAEQLPIEIVDRLAQLKAGETISFRSPRALVIYELQSAEAAPLAWTAATPIIKAHLAKQDEVVAFREELKSLHATAKISRKKLAD